MDHAHDAPHRACLAPGPGHAGQSAVGARVPENSWGHRRSWRRRTVPQYRGCTPTPTSQITEAEVFHGRVRHDMLHEGYGTIAGDPTRQAAVRIAVSRLAHALDRPLRKGRPGRPRTRQIGRSDAEIPSEISRCLCSLFFTSPFCFNRDRLVTRRAPNAAPHDGPSTRRRHARRKESPDDTDPNTLTRHTR